MKSNYKDFNCEYSVEGMHCAACELLIEKKFSKVDGIQKVDAQLSKSKVFIKTNKELNVSDLNALIEQDGYRLVEQINTRDRFNLKNYFVPFIAAIVIFLVFLLLQKLGIINLTNTNSEITLPFVFFIGVIASLSTCMAVVGGLVLSISSSYTKQQKTVPLISFHLSRLFSFFVLGGIIGMIGSAATLTPLTSFILNMVLFFVMLIMAFNLLEIFSFTNKFQLKMPKTFAKRIINIEDKNSIVIPLLLGAATFFLPCGFTQSMQLYSLTTGNALSGAITMLVFALGTFPVLAAISFASARFSKTSNSGLFFKTAGFVVILFAIFNLVTSLVSIGVLPPIFNI